MVLQHLQLLGLQWQYELRPVFVAKHRRQCFTTDRGQGAGGLPLPSAINSVSG
jgi:hypothetical protein